MSRPLCSLTRPLTRLLRGAAIAIVPLTAADAASAQVSAEPAYRPGTWLLTAQLGGAAFTDFRRAQARPVGAAAYPGDMQRRVSARTSVTLGGSATYWAGPSWGVRLGASYVPTRFSVWNEKGAEKALVPAADYEPLPDAALGIWLADLDLVFRFPHMFGRVLPYGLVGGGLVYYDIRDDSQIPPEARERFAEGGRSAAAAVLGIGAAIPLQQENMLLHFELTNHMTRTPLDEVGDGEYFHIGGVPMQLTADPVSGSDGVGMISNLRLTLGITVPVR